MRDTPVQPHDDSPPEAHASPTAVLANRPPARQSWLASAWSEMSLTRAQSLVAILSGIITIAGALYSVTQLFRPAPGTGELVAVVQEAKSRKSVTDATVEVLTPLDALVATLTPDRTGRARSTLKEGMYVVRVSHPRYSAEVRKIQVFARQTVEIQANLRAGSSLPLDHAKQAIDAGKRAVGRVLGF